MSNTSSKVYALKRKHFKESLELDNWSDGLKMLVEFLDEDNSITLSLQALISKGAECILPTVLKCKTKAVKRRESLVELLIKEGFTTEQSISIVNGR
jgi:hypothetical protein